MAFTEVEISVRQIDKTTWELLEPVEYKNAHETYVVPAGFKTDFASVPTLLTWLVPRYGIYTKSAILHDFLYRKGSIPRSHADEIFRHTLHELDVPFLRRWLMWAAARIFGSQMAGTHPLEILQLSVLIIVAVILLTLPVIAIGLTLVLFWLVEIVLFGLLFLHKRITGKQEDVCRPKVLGPLKE